MPLDYNTAAQIKKASQDIGMRLACGANDIPFCEFVKKAAFVNTTLQARPIQHALCKIAAAIFEGAGMGDTDEARLYKTLEDITATTTLTKVSCSTFLCPTIEAFSAASDAILEEDITKEAAYAVPGLVSKLIGKSTATIPEVVRTLALAGVAVGGTLGTVGWALNRDANVEDEGIEIKNRQAAYYRRVAKDIQRKLKLEHTSNKVDRKLAKDIESQGDGAYVL